MALLIEYRLVTDRQRDGKTDRALRGTKNHYGRPRRVEFNQQ